MLYFLWLYLGLHSTSTFLPSGYPGFHSDLCMTFA